MPCTCAGAGTGGDEDYQAAAARLNALFASKQMDARELRGLVFEKVSKWSTQPVLALLANRQVGTGWH